MIKLVKNHINLFKEIENQQLIKNINSKLDLFVLIFTCLFIGVPYFICFFNGLIVFNSGTFIFHMIVWSISLFTPTFFGCFYLFMYQLLKCYYEDNPLLNSFTSLKVFFGGLLNPVSLGFGLILSLAMEILI